MAVAITKQLNAQNRYQIESYRPFAGGSKDQLVINICLLS